MTDNIAPTRPSNDQRKERTAGLIATQVASGARVESQSDYQAVMVTGGRVNHVLHLILTILTAGLWLFVWVPLALIGGEKRSIASVDEWGNAMVAKV